jgi:hypothetical protein
VFAKLPDSTADLSPWDHWRMPVIVKEISDELLGGPVLVTIEYSVIAEQESKFMRAMRQYARVRRRDGAYRWGIYRDIEVANQFVEISWSIRGPNIFVNMSGKQQRIVSWSNGSTVTRVGEPRVRHLLCA